MKLGRGLTKLASKLALVGGMLAGCEAPDTTVSKNIDNNRFGTKTAALTATEVMQDQTPALKASWTQPGDRDLGVGKVKDAEGNEKTVVTFTRGNTVFYVLGSSIDECLTSGEPKASNLVNTEANFLSVGPQFNAEGTKVFYSLNAVSGNVADVNVDENGSLNFSNTQDFPLEGNLNDASVYMEAEKEMLNTTDGNFLSRYDFKTQELISFEDINSKVINGDCGTPVKDPVSGLWFAPRETKVGGVEMCKEVVVGESEQAVLSSTKKVGGLPAGTKYIATPRVIDGHLILAISLSNQPGNTEIYYKELPEDVIVNPDTDVVEQGDVVEGSDAGEGSDTTDSTDGGVEGTDAVEGTDTTDGTDSSDTADSTDGGVDADVVEPEDIQETPDEVSSPDVEETKEDVQDDIQMPEEVSKDTSEDISEVLDSQTPDVEEVEQCLKELKEFKLTAGDCEISICKSKQVADVYLASVLGKTTKTCEAEFTVDGVAGTGVLRFENIKGGQIKVSCSVTPVDPPLCDAENIGSGARIMEDGQGAKMGSKFGAVTGSEASDWSQFLVDATADTQTFEITSFNKPDEPKVFTRLNETTFVVIPSDGKPRTVTVSNNSIDLEELPDFPDVGVKTDVEIHKTDAGNADSTSPDAGNISKPPVGGGDGGCNAGPFNPGSSPGAALGAMAAVGLLMTVRNRRRQKEEAL